MQAQEKPTPWYIRIAKYFFFKVLVFDLALVALTAASFWFLGPWSALAYSDRLFWVGVVVILAGGLVLMVMSFVRRDERTRMAPEPGEPEMFSGGPQVCFRERISGIIFPLSYG